MSQFRVAADIGGTFTDIALIEADGAYATCKVPSTPGNYADAVVDGIRQLLASRGLAASDASDVLHACTVATNAILEHKGAKTALITTAGFRDVLELRRIRVPRLYDPLYVKPTPLVPRRLRLEVDERIGPKGDVVRKLDLAGVRKAIAAIKAAKVDAVAVTLLHSYANPDHERRIGDMLRKALPGHFVSLSIEVLPEMREYERTSTTVINAYVGPPVHAYLSSLRDQLKSGSIDGRLLVMQSSGGILDVQAVLDRPSQIVECGPAAGVIGALHMGRMMNRPNLITFDMGGTTAKASIIENGKLLRAEEYEVGGELSVGTQLLRSGGYALKLPAIDIAEVGAGGGSIVWLDKANAIKVGPQSAGAVPGPACYGAGGEAPTITDSNVVLGYLNPKALAGGTVPIDDKKAHGALREKIAAQIGRDVLDTAYGVQAVVNANMMRAIKAVTTYRGRDPRDFSLIAFGGNGGVHAAELARSLRIREVIVPAAAGVFSAIGLLFANLELTKSCAVLKLTDEAKPGELADMYDGLEALIAREMGYRRETIAFHRHVDMRYAGQGYELSVPAPSRKIDKAWIAEVVELFEAEHERSYGHRLAGEYPFEIVNLRVAGTIDPGRPATITGTTHTAVKEQSVARSRAAYFGPRHGLIDTPVIARRDLAETPRTGPLIVEEYEGTIVVPPGCSARRDAFNNVVIDVGAG